MGWVGDEYQESDHKLYGRSAQCALPHRLAIGTGNEFALDEPALEAPHASAQFDLEASSDAMLMITPTGHVLAMNERASDLLGCERDELLGVPLPIAVRHKTRGYLEVGLALEPDPGGTVATTLHPLGGRVDLDDDDLAGLAHDLRTPLSIVALDVGLLYERLPAYASAEVRRALKRMEQNVAFMDRLLNGLLDLASIEAARLHLMLEPTELAGLLADVAERTTPDRDRFRVFVEAPGPVMVMADALRIERVIANLLHNAIQYSPASSEITLRLERVGDNARITVIDVGPGMAPDDAKHVFERFRRGRNSRGRTGCGLGLYVSRRIVEAHGGRIGVETALGHGSRFHFTLPLIDHVW